MSESASGQPLPGNLIGELILDQMSDAVIYSDQGGIIRRWNATAAAMFGFSAEEALGQSLDIIIPENLRVAHWRGFHAAMKNGSMRLNGRPTLTRALHRSGSTLSVEMGFGLVVDAAGTVLGSVAVARDVTEKVEREKAAARNAGG